MRGIFATALAAVAQAQFDCSADCDLRSQCRFGMLVRRTAAEIQCCNLFAAQRKSVFLKGQVDVWDAKEVEVRRRIAKVTP